MANTAPNAKQVVYTPSGSITATNVQDAVQQAATAASISPPIQITHYVAAQHTNTLRIDRDASYTGGTPGWVNGAVVGHTVAGANNADFEWAILGYVDNYATAGENVGVYGQGNMWSTGPTWGMVAEATDMTNSPTTVGSSGLVGIEVDCYANGDDAYERRVGIQVGAGNAQLIRNSVPGVGPNQAARAIWITGDNTNAWWKVGVDIISAKTAGIRNSATGTYGILHSGTYNVGIDISTATHSTGTALRLKHDDYIAMEASDVVRFKYNNSTGFLEFYSGTTRKGYMDFGAGGVDVQMNASGSGGGSTFTTITVTDGTSGGRIKGDFSNANPVLITSFQSTTVNGDTKVGIIPNGTNTSSSINAINNSTATNSGIGQFGISNTATIINSTVAGSGTQLPIDFQMAGTTKARLGTTGHLLIGTTTDNGSGALLQVNGSMTLVTALGIASGGTGASSAAGARTNLAVPGLADANTLTNTNIFTGSVQFQTATTIFYGDVAMQASVTTAWTGTGNVTTSATGGAATALPSNPQGYLRIKIDGIAYKIPYYN